MRGMALVVALATLMVASVAIMAEESIDYGQYDEYEQNDGGRPPCGTWIKKYCDDTYFVRVTNKSDLDGIAVWGESYGGTGIKGTGEVWGGYFEGNGYFSGNVGIGTTEPSEKLHVNGGTALVGLVGIGANPLSYKQLYVEGKGVQFDYTAGIEGTPFLVGVPDGTLLYAQSGPDGMADGSGIVVNSDNHDIDFLVESDTSADAFFVRGSDGNVGIGTTNPNDFKLQAAGDVGPDSDNQYNLGSPSKRWANVYTADLHLKNNKGDWTIQEEKDMLVVINNKTGKRYKMVLQELED